MQEGFLSKLARRTLSKCAARIHKKSIEGIGRNATFEVIFQNQDILALLSQLPQITYQRLYDSHFALASFWVSEVHGCVHVDLRGLIAKKTGLLRPTMTHTKTEKEHTPHSGLSYGTQNLANTAV